MKNISRRKFVFCQQIEREVPLESGEQCCDFFNGEKHKCEFSKYTKASSSRHISYREELYKEFSNFEEE
jgi:hypothetical protein